jgi:hypothetical protein
MKKSWVISLIVIFFSLFIVNATDQTNNYEPQSGYEPSLSSAIIDNKPINVPAYIASVPTPPKVLGETTDEKLNYVDLSNQRLYAYEGNKLIFNPSFTGKVGTHTDRRVCRQQISLHQNEWWLESLQLIIIFPTSPIPCFLETVRSLPPEDSLSMAPTGTTISVTPCHTAVLT